MSNTVIKVENLFKEYRLGTIGHGTLRHDLASWWANVRGKDDPNSLITKSAPSAPAGHLPALRGEGKKDVEELKQHFLALNDVSFDVKAGEVLGIIGRNGAGKSTLLKILSRVTAPSAGTIKIKGRMASLLEVGTGFHPELTGRENTYMNGAILGMRRYEIARKMDEIVAFAELEKFIDTPVKRYSSGMYVRLAFAIAAHLDAEILVMDEVLAVGDATFQKKCLGKMDDVAKNQGRTVLFVSHNMAAVNELCSTGIFLDKGVISCSGTVNKAIDYYKGLGGSLFSSRKWIDLNKSPYFEEVVVKGISLINSSMQEISHVYVSEQVGVLIEYEVVKTVDYFTHGINLYDSAGLHVFTSHDTNKYCHEAKVLPGKYRVIAWIPKNLLQEGTFVLSLAFMRYNPFRVLLHEKDVIGFSVLDDFKSGSARHVDYKGVVPGIIRPLLDWTERSYL